jgi:hypothetical protein
MAGAPLEEFTTLMQSTGPAWMRGPEDLINEAVRTSYTGNRIAAAGNMTDMVQGGDQIEDIIFLGESSDYERYDPNAEFSYAQPQTGTKWTAPWAFAKASVAWTKQDIGLNVESMGKKYRAQVYKRVMYQKHQNLWTGVCNGIEDEFWARPDSVNMESSTPSVPRKPYSIPCFVNEFTNGLPTAETDAGATVWTTVQQINPATSGNSAWKPYSVGGGSGAADVSGGYTFAATSAVNAAGLFAPFTKAWWNLRFDRLPKNPQYSDKTTSPQVIWCSIQGVTNYEVALRLNQDTFRGVGKTSGQDPAYDMPTFRSTPMEVISSLGDNGTGTGSGALLYSDGTEVVDELGLTAAGGAGAGPEVIGPRYYFINTNYLKFVVHTDNYCKMTDPFMPSSQPFTRVQVMDLWNNNVCRSRKRLGIVGPSADITSA